MARELSYFHDFKFTVQVWPVAKNSPELLKESKFQSQNLGDSVTEYFTQFLHALKSPITNHRHRHS